MWFFMISCYVMSLVSFLALIIAFFQSFYNFAVFQANHVSFMILTSILYLFTETLVIFFFVGTGVSVKEYVKEHHLGTAFYQRMIQLKRKVYPPLLLNMLFLIILFIAVGAVDTYRLLPWIYQSYFILCIIHYVYIKIIENNCFRENTQIILEMSGISSRTP